MYAITTSKLIKHSTLKVGTVTLISLSSFCGSNPSYAALINGGFETGDFTGFSKIGNTSVFRRQCLEAAQHREICRL